VSGSRGTIVHYDGAQWSSAPSLTPEDLTSVWGTSSSDIWAAGYSTILHYDGSSWSVSYNPDNPLDKALILTGWSSSPTDAWAASDTGMEVHGRQSTWDPHSIAAQSGPGRLPTSGLWALQVRLCVG
jgi:hypothetical protein